MNKVFIVIYCDKISEIETMHGIFSSFEKAKDYATQQMQNLIENMYHDLIKSNKYISLKKYFNIIEVILDSNNNNQRVILSVIEENVKLSYLWVDGIDPYMYICTE